MTMSLCPQVGDVFLSGPVNPLFLLNSVFSLFHQASDVLKLCYRKGLEARFKVLKIREYARSHLIELIISTGVVRHSKPQDFRARYVPEFFAVLLLHPVGSLGDILFFKSSKQ